MKMILHKELDKGKFMCLECLVQKLINYLRLRYAQFLVSFLTAVFIFLSTWLLIIAFLLKMYSKYVRPKQIMVSHMLKLVGKWLIASCYFQHCDYNQWSSSPVVQAIDHFVLLQGRYEQSDCSDFNQTSFSQVKNKILFLQKVINIPYSGLFTWGAIFADAFNVP